MSGGEVMCKHRLLAVLLLICLFAQAMAHARAASITFDEGPHLAIGYATLRTGDLRLQPVHIHPPLANALAAAPLLLQNDLLDPRSIDGWQIASLSAVTDEVVWRYPHPRRLAMAARFPIILMTMLLGAFIFRWASDLFGPRAGLLALFLHAFDPNIIAHGSLVTTDMAVVLWSTAALFLTARYLRHGRWGYWAGAGVMLGLALASKVSAISLAPVMGLLCLLGPRALSWRKRFLAAAGCLFLASLTLWAAYGFQVDSLPGIPAPIPAATHLEIYLSLQEHYNLGHPAFLMGQNSDHGWWYYFPIAFALKTPLPTLLLLIASAVSILRTTLQYLTSTFQPPTPILRWSPLLMFPLIYAASTPFSSVNIGYRHLLPLLPFLFIIASRFTFHVLRFTFYASRLMFYALLLCLPILTLRLSPHYLAYFNAPDGYRYLVDSNLDWGQNLWQLGDWMKEHNVERVHYAHYSPARPSVYGIQVDFLPPDPRAVDFRPFDPAPGIYAIGATALQGAYTPDINTYAWFRSREPAARLGHALFIYDVPPRPEPTWAAVCTDPAPVLSPNEVRARFGEANLRIILLNCEQSWVYPAGEQPGAYISAGNGPPGAALEISARGSDDGASYRLYRVEEMGLKPTPPERAVRLDGPLLFLGHRLNRDDLNSQRKRITLWTFWEVQAASTRSLSLMAHLIGPEGSAVAVGDGLGAPASQWRPGDVIVQRHRLQAPEDAPAGEYQLRTGAYWLDTMERWAVQIDDGVGGDYIQLEEITIRE